MCIFLLYDLKDSLHVICCISVHSLCIRQCLDVTCSPSSTMLPPLQKRVHECDVLPILLQALQLYPGAPLSRKRMKWLNWSTYIASACLARATWICKECGWIKRRKNQEGMMNGTEKAHFYLCTETYVKTIAFHALFFHNGITSDFLSPKMSPFSIHTFQYFWI